MHTLFTDRERTQCGRRELRLALCGVLTVVLYPATLVLERSMFGSEAAGSAVAKVSADSGVQTTLLWQVCLYVMVTVVIFLIYGKVICLSWRGELSQRRPRLVGFAV